MLCCCTGAVRSLLRVGCVLTHKTRVCNLTFGRRFPHEFRSVVKHVDWGRDGLVRIPPLSLFPPRLCTVSQQDWPRGFILPA